MKRDFIYDPTNDGIDHINIYSKGATELGRFLTNFSKQVIKTDDGQFSSIEAYWYWLKCEGKPERESLRNTSGFEAKKIGRKILYGDEKGTKTESPSENEEFIAKIKKAIKIKICSDKRMQSELTKSSLPFTHYYNYGGKVIPAGYEWIVEYVERIRSFLKEPKLGVYKKSSGKVYSKPEEIEAMLRFVIKDQKDIDKI